MSRPAKRRRWPVPLATSTAKPQLRRRLGKRWWGQVPCGKTCSGGPLGEWDTPRLPVLLGAGSGGSLSCRTATLPVSCSTPSVAGTCRCSFADKRVRWGDRAMLERSSVCLGSADEDESTSSSGVRARWSQACGQPASTLTPMPPQRITTDSRSAARWAGTHADLKAVNNRLSDCFKDMRQQEQSEWAAANPLPQELSAGASKVEQMTAEHLRMVREIRRLTKDDRFTGSCCLELANRPMEVMDDLEEVLPSVTNDRIKYVHMRRKYLRDDIWMSASVDFESRRVGILVEGTDPRWVESTASQLEKSLRARRPRWAPLASHWGSCLSQLAFGFLVAAIFWRVTDGPGVAPPWWALAGAVLISFLATGNLTFLNWLLPNVDIYSPGSQPTGTTHLKWVDAAIAAAVLGVIFDILLRG